jgi:hypothetical protein
MFSIKLMANGLSLFEKNKLYNPKNTDKAAHGLRDLRSIHRLATERGSCRIYTGICDPYRIEKGMICMATDI